MLSTGGRGRDGKMPMTSRRTTTTQEMRFTYHGKLFFGIDSILQHFGCQQDQLSAVGKKVFVRGIPYGMDKKKVTFHYVDLFYLTYCILCRFAM